MRQTLTVPNAPQSKQRRGILRAARALFPACILITRISGAEPIAQAATSSLGDHFDRTIAPLVKKYCHECHGPTEAEGGLSFSDYRTAAEVLGDRPTWQTVQNYVRAHQMPPSDATRMPSADERRQLVEAIDDLFFPLDPSRPDPGRVTIRRLNRVEYNNTIRDLVGVDFRPADDFPADDSGYGFDNIGDVLSLPPLLMEKYLAAAEQILDRAIVTAPAAPTVRRFATPVLQAGWNAKGDRGDGWLHLISQDDDDAGVEIEVPSTADYLVRVHAFSRLTGGINHSEKQQAVGEPDPPEPAMFMTLARGDVTFATFKVTPDEANPGTYEARVCLPAGRHRVRAICQRLRGGKNEWAIVNKQIGKQQPGILFVRWLEIDGPVPGVVRRFSAQDLAASGRTQPYENGATILRGPGEVNLPIRVRNRSEYVVRLEAYADQAGAEPARMELRLDGKPLRVVDVLAPGHMQFPPGKRALIKASLTPRPGVYETRLQLEAGDHIVSAAFINDFEDPDSPHPSLRDRNLVIQSMEAVELSGTWEPPTLPEPLRALFEKHHRGVGSEIEMARGIISDFASRAWRRPTTAEEVDRMMRLYRLAETQRLDFPSRVKLALQATLASPHFLFRLERPLEGQSAAVVHRIDEFALAARLSYFLWSSMPDDELFAVANRGELRANLPAQVRRMLASPKAEALTKNFASQWLQTRALRGVYPAQQLFPEFDDWLRDAMQQETELFFSHIRDQDRSILEFLTADYTFVNERLAKHYGIPGVRGGDFHKVSLAQTNRRGVLTHGSVLALTSNPNRTSPVKRGKWVLDNLLGLPPPPPPPDVPDLEVEGKKLTGTLREQMQKHRANPNCASCHEQMDAIGFGLENFTATGAWRDKDGQQPIDATGLLGAGTKFAGALELTAALASTRRAEFVQCLTEKMLTYALGRGVEPTDRLFVRDIVRRVEQGEFRFSSLMLGIVESVPFQMQRGSEQHAAVLRRE